LIVAHDYSAKDNPKAAREFFRYAIANAELLVQYPQTGRTGRVHGTRELVLVKYPYIIPYRVKSQEVQILHVFHSSRVWPRAMGT
jgi:toxin ParE1/3/4